MNNVNQRSKYSFFKLIFFTCLTAFNCFSTVVAVEDSAGSPPNSSQKQSEKNQNVKEKSNSNSETEKSATKSKNSEEKKDKKTEEKNDSLKNKNTEQKKESTEPTVKNNKEYKESKKAGAKQQVQKQPEQKEQTQSDSEDQNQTDSFSLPEVTQSEIDAENENVANEPSKEKPNIFLTILSLLLVCSGIFIIVKVIFDNMKIPRGFDPRTKMKHGSKKGKYTFKIK